MRVEATDANIGHSDGVVQRVPGVGTLFLHAGALRGGVLAHRHLVHAGHGAAQFGVCLQCGLIGGDGGRHRTCRLTATLTTPSRLIGDAAGADLQIPKVVARLPVVAAVPDLRGLLRLEPARILCSHQPSYIGRAPGGQRIGGGDVVGRRIAGAGRKAHAGGVVAVLAAAVLVHAGHDFRWRWRWGGRSR